MIMGVTGIVRACVVLIFLVDLTIIFASDLSSEVAESTEGGQARLPCPLVPLQVSDKASSVVWFKGSSDSPIYKYDVKGSRAQHWSESKDENRYFLRELENSDRAELTISPIRLTDEDVYRCQVDFFRSPARITHVNLTVIGKMFFRFDESMVNLYQKRCISQKLNPKTENKLKKQN